MKPGDPADPPTIVSRTTPDRHDGDDDRDDSETLVPKSRDRDDSETLVPQTRERAGALVVEDPTTISGVYALGELLGRGGMGEVLLAHDRRIGREVALKRLRGAEPSQDEVARFLREARIQARLEHPAIVPVYELARDGLGRPYFTMKRLSGITLADMLGGQVATRQRLLRAFADVCRAVDFAHSRGVVHRDLKPANLVLGDFGEVYLLDWGVARVLDAATDVATADTDTLEGSAPTGQVLGTPGYMAPEQFSDPEVGRPADVYALGAMLFEVLAGEPLHPRGAAAGPSTLAGMTVLAPATRRPDRGIAPELDALCSAMLARSPTARPTARRCADRIEEYLDGDRDLERRRSLALELVREARVALPAGRRAEAMQAAGRALALDPRAAGAAELVTMLMLEPPREPPGELREALRAADHDGISRHARAALPGYILIAAFLPIIVWNGVLAWSVVIAAATVALVMALAAWQLIKRPERSFAEMVIYAIGNALIIAVVSRLTGPFTFVPALVAFMTASVITYPAFLERPWVLLGTMLGGFLVPIALEVVGVLPLTWELRAGELVSLGNAMALDGPPAVVTILLACVAVVVMGGVQSARIARQNRQAQHQLVAQAWHLRQLLPRPAPSIAAG